MELVSFYIFSAVAVVAAAMVILLRRPVYSALALIVCLASVAVLFFQLGAPFIGAIQVIVYAGAIMVLFLFVVMLLDPESEMLGKNRLRSISFISIPIALLFLGVLLGSFGEFDRSPATGESLSQSTSAVATQLFQDYLLPFEVTSILILVAVMGAIVLAGRPQD